MARVFNQITLKILGQISSGPGLTLKQIWKNQKDFDSYKELYNAVFRLAALELVKKERTGGDVKLTITEEGEKLLARKQPKRDGMWKLVIFDIPEKQKYVRAVLRAKLKSLNFKKWQNSIYVSPFALDREIEEELNALAKKFFVRLIKTTEINENDDLEKMFADKIK